MKNIAALLTMLAVVAGLASQAEAATHRKKKHVYAQQYRAYPPKVDRQRDDDDPSGYYEHRLEAVRFGSRRWWLIYDEHSGGGQLGP